MTKKVFIGIDTSNYTTSCAIVDFDGNVLENERILLPVKDGEQGLRQSDAVFAHIKNFESISASLKKSLQKYEPVAVGYSAYPRDIMGSYMPCFLVGQAIAEMISAITKTESYKFSHQQGHIEASVFSSGINIDGPFIAFHVSGGTTEIVYVTPTGNGYTTEILGGSVDLHAGQAIDRIGVKMGLKFPCGKEIERLANENTEKLPPVKVCVNDFDCNLSGLENLSLKLYKETENKALVCDFVLKFIEKTLEKLVLNLRKKYGDINILFAGGVMSNKIIQDALKEKFKSVYFAMPALSTDNAVGIAQLTRKKHLN